MLHILCKGCKCWIPRKRGRHAYSYTSFKPRVKGASNQIECLCGRWTYNPRNANIYGTKEQIDAIRNVKRK